MVIQKASVTQIQNENCKHITGILWIPLVRVLNSVETILVVELFKSVLRLDQLKHMKRSVTVDRRRT